MVWLIPEIIVNARVTDKLQVCYCHLCLYALLPLCFQIWPLVAKHCFVGWHVLSQMNGLTNECESLSGFVWVHLECHCHC